MIRISSLHPSERFTESVSANDAVEYERKEPPPFSQQPPPGILKRSPSSARCAASAAPTQASGVITPRAESIGAHVHIDASNTVTPTLTPSASGSAINVPNDRSPHYSHQPHHSDRSSGLLETISRTFRNSSVGASLTGRGHPGVEIKKRQSFADQHGLNLRTVHEVNDTHYKRTFLQRNAKLVMLMATSLVMAVCILVVVLTLPASRAS